MLNFDPNTLPGLIEQGYIMCQVHPTLPLTIYNYTSSVQYAKAWNPATLACRGLVLDDQYRPIARPLTKFFNLQEFPESLPNGIPSIYEKLDGSLILLFFYAETWHVASRGSFTSEQAIKASELLPNYPEHQDLDQTYTYILEIIYPNNRIVLDYGNSERLVMLAAINTQTGIELDLDCIAWSDRAKSYPATEVPEWIASLNESELENQEGFILKWPNGFRIKYKLAEYVRLHRVLTRIQAKDIWECLSEKQDLAPFLEAVPDEFYQWVKTVTQDLEAQYAAIEAECLASFKDLGDRKATAAYFQTQSNVNIKVLFLMLDKRDYSSVIWKQIKPPFQRPFRLDPDA